MNDDQKTNEANAVGQPPVGADPAATPPSGAASGSPVELGECPRNRWYGPMGKSLRSQGWRLRKKGPKFDPWFALIERPKAMHCAYCDGIHAFDTSVASPQWNAVVRKWGYPDFLCLPCILMIFMRCKEPFDARLWGWNFNGASLRFSPENNKAE